MELRFIGTHNESEAELNISRAEQVYSADRDKFAVRKEEKRQNLPMRVSASGPGPAYLNWDRMPASLRNDTTSVHVLKWIHIPCEIQVKWKFRELPMNV
jgi:hypothetical protein